MRGVRLQYEMAEEMDEQLWAASKLRSGLIWVSFNQSAGRTRCSAIAGDVELQGSQQLPSTHPATTRMWNIRDSLYTLLTENNCYMEEITQWWIREVTVWISFIHRKSSLISSKHGWNYRSSINLASSRLLLLRKTNQVILSSTKMSSHLTATPGWIYHHHHHHFFLVLFMNICRQC